MFVNTTQSKNTIQPEATANKIEQEAASYAALKLIAHIDQDLIPGIHHYRDRTGRPLTTLEEV